MKSWDDFFKGSSYSFKEFDVASAEIQKNFHLLPTGSERYAEKRKKEFIAGRLCALEAIKSLSIEPPETISIGANREPLWPSGLCGSISHSKNRAVAVVSNSLVGVGVDTEESIQLDRLKKIGGQFIGENEQKFLQDSPLNGTIIFSAKESLFKALYPSVKQFFGFKDAEILQIGSGEFLIRLLRSDGLFSQYSNVITGYYRTIQTEVVTYIPIS